MIQGHGPRIIYTVPAARRPLLAIAAAASIEEAAAALKRGDEQAVAAHGQRYTAQAEIEAAATQALAALSEKLK